MSSANVDRSAMLEALRRDAGRRATGLTVMYHQAVAERLGLSVTDLKCLDLATATDTALTAGQLAELSNLTTGAITGVLDRLEQAGFVRREPDPQDRRRVVIRPRPERSAEVDALFEPLERAQAELVARYPDAEIAVLLDYVSRSTSILREETARLRATASRSAAGETGDVTRAPLDDVSRGQFTFQGGSGRIVVHGGAPEGELYHASFEGKPPAVQVRGGIVSMRYRGLRLLDLGNKVAEVALAGSIPWTVDIRAGGTMIDVDLQAIVLESLSVSGAGSAIGIRLPRPAGLVPVRVSAGGSSIEIHRPAGTAARARLRGHGSGLLFDGQYVAAGEAWAQSAASGTAEDGFEIEIAASGSGATVDAVGA